MRPAKDQAEHILHIPSADRWTERKDESVSGTVPTTLLWEPTKGMGILVAPGTVHPELLAKRIYQKIPVRTHPRIRTIGTPTIKRSKYPRHQRAADVHQRSKRRSSMRTETGTGKDDQRNKVQRLRNWK